MSLNFNLSACGFQRCLDLGRFFLGSVVFNRLRSGFNQILGFFQTQVGDGTDFFDHLNLLVTGIGQDDLESRLLLSRSLRTSACCLSSAGGLNGNGRLG